ncbi:hypothetical protein PTKU64_94430 (plasmid) [Paraburkholderia terrae]|uniref:DUF4113 domain-containing protein n=1 Tax=Paraburkholderia terrae TaxID=311230 RepID=A0ABN6JXT4_9BURK|nr:hypothetical protein PTKU64_94430 [Paraburkholderia terrae]
MNKGLGKRLPIFAERKVGALISMAGVRNGSPGFLPQHWRIGPQWQNSCLTREYWNLSMGSC